MTAETKPTIREMTKEQANAHIGLGREAFISFYSRHRGNKFPNLGLTGGQMNQVEAVLASLTGNGRLLTHDNRHYGVFGYDQNIRIWPLAQGGYVLHGWGKGQVITYKSGRTEAYHSDIYEADRILFHSSILLPEDRYSTVTDELMAHIYDNQDELVKRGLFARFKKEQALPELQYRAVQNENELGVQWDSEDAIRIMGHHHLWKAFEPIAAEDKSRFVPLLRAKDPVQSPLQGHDHHVSGVVRVDPFVYAEPELKIG